MKTKLFYLIIAVFMFSLSGIAQTYPTITLIGSGNGGWTDTAETTMLTSDGITYTLVDRVLSTGELKFREGKCWTGGCPATVTNKFGWGPAVSTQTGWPSGSNNAPADNGPNIQSQAGVWTITFNRIAGSWSFVPGTPLPVIKLVGTGVVAVGGATLTTGNGTLFTAKKVALKPGTCQFSVDGVLAGALTFPTGDALSATQMIPVGTTGIDYDITFDFTLYKYVFTVATFPSIALVGNAVGGWPGEPGNPGPIDKYQMTTTDGVTYTLNNVPVVGLGTGATANGCVFRGGNAWNIKYGNTPFPTGTNSGGQDIKVPAGMTGTYNVTLNTSTGAYNFSKITFAIVGEAVGGWPNDPGNPGPIDLHQLSTVDGVNYTKNNLVVTTAIPNGGAKFRLNNAWAGGDWGGDAFPAGAKTGGNIPTVAGTYNLTVNVLTGFYDFGANLSVNKFDTASFKAYPNPTTDSWNIVSGNDDIISIQVYDVLGKSVYARTAASKEVTINASELSRGVYYARVATENGESTLKLVKE